MSAAKRNVRFNSSSRGLRYYERCTNLSNVESHSGEGERGIIRPLKGGGEGISAGTEREKKTAATAKRFFRTEETTRTRSDGVSHPFGILNGAWTRREEMKERVTRETG